MKDGGSRAVIAGRGPLLPQQPEGMDRRREEGKEEEKKEGK